MDGLKLFHLQAAILDWAGTAVDHGSLAPVAALERVFAENGVAISTAEARRDMGLLKKDHIRNILAYHRVAEQWMKVHGSAPRESDTERIFAEFLPRQREILAEFSTPIEGVCAAVARWRQAGLCVGSSTGYTRDLLDAVMARAAPLGYSPDASVTPDEVGAGRPAPFMCYRNAIALGVFPLWRYVKIGDTPSDIAEGINAGMWTIGITRTGNEIGMPAADFAKLSSTEREALERKAAERLLAAGADYIAPAVAECDAALIDIERRLASGDRPRLDR